MRLRRTAGALCACLAAVMLMWLPPGCSGSSSAPQPGQSTQGPPFTAIDLPSPAELLELRQASAGITGEGLARFRQGNEFNASLPNQHVIPALVPAVFEPVWDPEANPVFADSAFCIYSFSVAGFDGDSLSYSFSGGPADWGDLWLGLADFEHNRWSWFAADPGGTVQIPHIEWHLGGSGEIFVAPVLLGTESAALQWLRVGGNLAPVAAINADKTAGEPGLEVNFSALASRDYDGEVTKYEWDLDGDGNFELDTGTTPAASHTYEDSGTYLATVRVTDDAGLGATGSVQILVYGGGPFDFGFETGLQGWVVDATDVEKPGGEPGEEIDWEIALSSDLSYEGDTSLIMWMDNINDAGKIWIERPFELKPDTSYKVDIYYQFASSAEGEIGTWEIIAGALNYNPEVANDLFDNGCIPWDSTYNGGVSGYTWLDKQYTADVTTGADGKAYVVVGLWGVFEVLQTYYVDNVSIAFSEQ